MRFRVEHVFPGQTLERYEQLYLDEKFNIALCQRLGLGRELVKLDDTGGVLKRVVRITPDRQIPGPVAKVLGGQKIQYVEYLDYKKGSFRGTWRTEPSVMGDKIRSQGSFGFDKSGDGVRRFVEGEVEVKIFGLGGIVEKFIVSDVEKSYENAAAFTREYLSDARA